MNHLFEIDLFLYIYNNIEAFAVTFDQFNRFK